MLPHLPEQVAQLITRVLRRQVLRQIRIHRNRRELLEGAKPGIVMARHSWSSSLEFHPHWHTILTGGVFTKEGDFRTLFDWDVAAIQEDLRRSILAAFVRWSKFSPEVAENTARLGT